MARSKAISGGPVYLSDSPKEFVSENIFPLIDNNGKIFRPAAPAIPTPESILTNPLQDGKAYRVFAPTGDEAVSIICYNLNTSPKYREVTAGIVKEDYLLRETLTGKPDMTFGTTKLKVQRPPTDGYSYSTGRPGQPPN